MSEREIIDTGIGEEDLFDSRLLHHPSIAWMVLVTSLLLTFFAWRLSVNYLAARAEDHFQFQVEELEEAVRRRMMEYEQVLRGGVGFFEASDDVSREEWRIYVENCQLDKYFPGIQGMGVSKVLQPDEVEAYEQKIQGEGFPDFKIKPPGQRDLYTSIDYLEPFDWRNKRAHGFDMYSEPTRRLAMVRAMESGEPAISGKVTLVQEAETDIQAGFLSYLPLYKPGLPLTTSQERRKATEGFVYAAFRAGDLLRGTLPKEVAGLDYRIYDGSLATEENLLFDNRAASVLPKETARFKVTVPITLSGRKWNLEAKSDDFGHEGETLLSSAVAFSGLLIDALLFLTIASVLRQRSRAVGIAKAMTRELRDSQVELQNIVDHLPACVWYKDENNRILRINKTAAEKIGMEPHQVNGRMTEEFYPEFAADFLVDDREVITTRKPKLGIVEQVESDSGFRWLRTDKIPLVESDGSVDSVLVVSSDITELKEAEDKLIEARDQLEMAVEGGRVGLWEWELASDKMILSVQCREQLGQEPAEFHGTSQDWIDLLHPADRDPAKSRVDEFVKSDSDLYQSTFRLRHTDGTYRWIRSTGEATRDNSGTVLRISGSHIDITEQIERENKLFQYSKELERSNEELGQFAYVASHDLQEPLRKVTAFCELLESEYGDQVQGEASTYLKHITDGAKRMSSLVRDLLHYSRVSQNPIELQPVECKNAFAIAVDNLDELITESGGVIHCDSLPVVQADSVHMTQLFQNLIGNALKYRHPDVKPEVHVTSEKRDGMWHIAIADNGIGIEPRFHDRIFVIFQRLHRQSEYKGTGIGLAVCRKIVERFGGKIWVESNQGGGSRFVFTVPDDESISTEGVSHAEPISTASSH